MKPLLFRFILITVFLFSNLVAVAQNTWNWVGSDNNFAITHNAVTFFENKIITNGTTVFFGDTIPYVSLSLFKYDSFGNLLYDTLLGKIDTTYVPIYTSKVIGNTICNAGEVRYPNLPAKPYDQFASFINLDNNKIFKYIYPTDTIGSNYIKKSLILNSNRYCLLFQYASIAGGGPTTSAKLVIIDSLGNILNQKLFTNAGYWYLPTDLVQFEDNYFLVINKMLINNIQDPSNLVIYKLDSIFNPIDSFKTTSNNWYFGNSTLVFPNGDFVVGGVHSDAWEPDGDVWQKKYLRKFDKNLNILWTKYFGKRNLNTSITELFITSDGNILGTGTDGIATITNNGDTIGHITGCIFKFTADGDSLWMHNYQAIDDPLYGDNNELLDIDEMPDGGFVACGKSVAFFPYRQRGWLIRVDANGCLTPDCVSSTKEIDTNNTHVVFPNPSYENLNITNANQISFYQIFQFDGKLIAQGNTFPIKISEYANGLYFLRINTKSNQVINQKIIKQ
jgi:hypothetical protein